MALPAEGEGATCEHCGQEIVWTDGVVVGWEARNFGNFENPRFCHERLGPIKDHEPLDTPPPLDATDEVMAWLEH